MEAPNATATEPQAPRHPLGGLAANTKSATARPASSMEAMPPPPLPLRQWPDYSQGSSQRSQPLHPRRQAVEPAGGSQRSLVGRSGPIRVLSSNAPSRKAEGAGTGSGTGNVALAAPDALPPTNLVDDEADFPPPMAALSQHAQASQAHLRSDPLPAGAYVDPHLSALRATQNSQPTQAHRNRPLSDSRQLAVQPSPSPFPGASSPTSQGTPFRRSISFAAPAHAMDLRQFVQRLQTVQTTGCLQEHHVTELLARLSSIDQQRVAAHLYRCGNFEAFAATFSELVECPLEWSKLGLELSLEEFKRSVLGAQNSALLRRASNARTETAISESNMELLMERLGPETRALVASVYDGRLSYSSFLLQLGQLTRPSFDSAFTEEELGAVTQSLLAAESRLLVVPLDSVQTHVNSRMRAILVDWLVDVCLRFRCCQDTLHLAVALVDRYLMVQRVTKQELQLVGLGALMLAAKYEMIYPPELKDYVYIAACTYPKEDMVRMERQIFVALEFNVTVPTSQSVADCILHQQDPTPSHRQMCVCGFLLDVALLVHQYGCPKPSVVATACVFLSRVWTGVPPAVEIADEVLQTAAAVLSQLAELRGDAPRLAAIREKWSASDRAAVAAEQLPAAVRSFTRVSSPTDRSPLSMLPPPLQAE